MNVDECEVYKKNLLPLNFRKGQKGNKVKQIVRVRERKMLWAEYQRVRNSYYEKSTYMLD
jgi:hypothetical protein